MNYEDIISTELKLIGINLEARDIFSYNLREKRNEVYYKGGFWLLEDNEFIFDEDYTSPILPIGAMLAIQPEKIRFNNYKYDLANFPFNKLTRLRILEINQSSLTELPDSIYEIENLEILDISNTPITSIRRGFKKLEYLGIDTTDISTLSARLFNSKLLGLSIRNCPLRSIPSSISLCIDLDVFVLENTFVQYLPDDFYNLFNLIHLELSGNRIKQLNEGISNLKKIGLLILEDINFDLELSFPSLDYLRLKNCALKAFPQFIRNLHLLEGLNLSNNSISKVPDWLSDLKQLKQLTLSNNMIAEFPLTIMISGLENINISNNLLIKFPIQLAQCNSLYEIILTGNQIDEVPVDILKIISDCSVELNDNKIATLPMEFYDENVDISLLNIKNNPLEQFDRVMLENHLSFSYLEEITDPFTFSDIMNREIDLEKFLQDYEQMQDED
ncbi:MAG: hypothetical protein INQ03_21225 [Candidatus Heimdallarchaeota archaeon]|nr:hypothetical protein [Candidatus Heimdallarchaeota archaeon]